MTVTWLRRTGSALGAMLAALTVVVAPSVSHAAGPRPFFQLPVACGETWTLSTYLGHDDYDIDLIPNSGSAWGRPILASYGGTVVKAGISGDDLGSITPGNPGGQRGNGGGYYVKIDHGNGWQTLYLHMLESPMVSVGQQVTIGQQLGKVGSTGDSSGPHLHYEQQADGSKIESHFNGVPSGITHDDYTYSVTRTSNNCGAPAQSSGAVAYNGVLHEFARGSDGSVKYWYAAGGGWSAPQTIPANLTSEPVATVYNGTLYVFGIGTDGSVKYWFANGGAWSGMQSISGGGVNGALSAIAANGTLYVFGRGSDGSIRYWYANGGAWSAPQTIAATNTTGAIATAYSSNVLYVFTIATDGTVKYWYAVGGGAWSSPQSISGAAVSGGLSAIAANGTLYVFARNTTGSLSYWFGTGGPWSAPQPISANVTGAVSTAYAGNVLYVFGRGTNAAMKYWFGTGGPWSAEQSIPGSAV
ncbi:peptidoglycan DD-metalloendopeptidase family protein [Dactylosporangium sp. NPDC000521]|uniref:peptidoglycan DD-metalloendopeptidase family protein n=1 Tax=Dactylosporangium sp. NPDC000521 TaxID=3363975 RepID=UPI0036B4C948